jgi:hypothetical protein
VLQQQPLISNCKAFISSSAFATTTATTSSSFYQQQQQRTRSFFSNNSIFGMSTHVTERDGSGTITVSPRNEAAQSGLIVICHGLGDTAEGKNIIYNVL